MIFDFSDTKRHEQAPGATQAPFQERPFGSAWGPRDDERRCSSKTERRDGGCDDDPARNKDGMLGGHRKSVGGHRYER